MGLVTRRAHHDEGHETPEPPKHIAPLEKLAPRLDTTEKLKFQKEFRKRTEMHERPADDHMISGVLAWRCAK